MRWVRRWRATRDARQVIANAATLMTPEIADALADAGVDAGSWVLVDVAAWLWLCEWADDPLSVSE